MKWGEKGKGDWITVYTNPGHAYVVIAGLRLDTSVGTGTYAARAKGIAATAFERGPRWRPMAASRARLREAPPALLLSAAASRAVASGGYAWGRTPTRR